MATNVCDTVQVVENMSFLIYIRLNVNYRFSAPSSNVIARASRDCFKLVTESGAVVRSVARYAFASSADDGYKYRLNITKLRRTAGLWSPWFSEREGMIGKVEVEADRMSLRGTGDWIRWEGREL